MDLVKHQFKLPVCASRKGNLIRFSKAIRVLKEAEFSTASR